MSKTLLLTILSAFILMLLSCGNPTTSDDGPETGTMTDIDGNVYKTIKIGNQVWMVENLRTTKYNDGTSIPHVPDSAEWYYLTAPAYCYYNNMTSADSIKKFGVLYNWYTIDTEKFAPAGWHVPTDAEWTILANYLIANGYNYDGTTTGNKIAKAMAAKTDWRVSTNEGAIGNDLTKNNRSGFSALPSGSRSYAGNFITFGSRTLWWSSTTVDYDSTSAWDSDLDYDWSSYTRYNNNKSFGFSVRLVKDSTLTTR